MNSLIVDDDKLSRTLIEKFVERTDFLGSYTSFGNAIDAINFMKKEGNNVDLIFLDIEMPEMDGVEFMRSLGPSAKHVQIVVVSAKEKYAIDAIEHNVIDYLLKPVTYARFLKSAEKALDRLNAPTITAGEKGTDFFIRSNNSLIRIKFADVIWVEALENYIVVNTFAEKYTIHFTMKAITERLPSEIFFRIHRSFIVNKNKIEIIKASTVEVNTSEGLKSLPIGKSYRDQLLDDINLFSK